jgi:hypothetical protein
MPPPRIARLLAFSPVTPGTRRGAFDEQLARLTNMGCDRAQGYLISRPLSAASVGGLFEELAA